MAAATNKRVTTAFIGDSFGYLVYKKQDNSFAIIKLTKEHNLNNPDETFIKDDCKGMHGKVYSKQVGKSLSVTRSLGDSAFRDTGKKDTSEIITTDIPADALQPLEAYIITASDGIENLTSLDQQTVLNIQNHKELTDKQKESHRQQKILDIFNAGQGLETTCNTLHKSAIEQYGWRSNATYFDDVIVNITKVPSSTDETSNDMTVSWGC